MLNVSYLKYKDKQIENIEPKKQRLTNEFLS